MARKVLNRKELREAADAAEKLEKLGKTPTKKKAKKKATRKTTKRSAASAENARLKAFWGVFNQSLKRVAMFEYAQREAADKKAEELSTSQKTPHFVRIVKNRWSRNNRRVENQAPNRTRCTEFGVWRVEVEHFVAVSFLLRDARGLFSGGAGFSFDIRFERPRTFSNSLFPGREVRVRN